MNRSLSLLVALLVGPLILFGCNDAPTLVPHEESAALPVGAEWAPETLAEFNPENLPVYRIEDLPAALPADVQDALVDAPVSVKDFPVNYLEYGPVGGSGGNYFSMALRRSETEQWRRLKVLRINYGRYVDAMEVLWKNDKGQIFSSGKKGGSGGTRRTVTLRDDEYIREATVRAGRLIDQLSLKTNYAVYTFGGYGGNQYRFNFASDGRQCHGFFGKAGRYIDQLGFYGYRPQDLSN